VVSELVAMNEPVGTDLEPTCRYHSHTNNFLGLTGTQSDNPAAENP
jgi:hypothetical protein